jgi:hypothetical protein
LAQAAEEHAQREADAAKRAVELNAHREAGLVATQVLSFVLSFVMYTNGLIIYS